MTNNPLVEALREARRALACQPHPLTASAADDKRAVLAKIDAALASSAPATRGGRGLVEWSAPAKGNGKDEFYDHCYGKTALGTFKIEWKSWKDYPRYSLIFTPPAEEFIYCGDTLESARDAAEDWLRDRLTALSSAPTTGEREQIEIPREIAEQVLSMGRVEWGATKEQTSAGHVADFAETLRITRENFNFEDVPVRLHGLYLEGTETVLCHTGTSPNSPGNAQALAGAWNWLVDQCQRDHLTQSGEMEGGEHG